MTGAIRRCNACGEVLTAEGHYVPPSMGEDGFFLCQRESVPAAAPSLPAGAGEPNEPQQALTYGVAPSVEMFARQFLTPTPCDECGEMVCRCVGSPRWKDELIAGLRSTLEERDQRIGELTAEVEEWKADAKLTERTAQQLDNEWQRLATVLGVSDEEQDGADNLWAFLVDRVASRDARIGELEKENDALRARL